MTLVLENVAGQGTTIGARFEELAWLRAAAGGERSLSLEIKAVKSAL